MIVCGLPASAGVTSRPIDGMVCPCSLITSERWATSSRIAADTATVVAPSTITLPSRNFLYIPRACVRTGREARASGQRPERVIELAIPSICLFDSVRSSVFVTQ